MNFAGFSAYKILIPNYNRMRIRALAFAMLMAFSSAVAVYAMTDDQVINYVKQRSAAGISHQQIGKELIAKGVSPEQVERLKAQYEDSQGSDANVADKSVAQNNRDRVRDASNEISAAALTDVGREVEEGGDGKVSARRIYGHSVFTNPKLSFEPNENIATPQNYRLGPGDEVVIDIWGANEDHIRQTISPEGRIMVSQIGPIYLNGLTIAEANKLIREAFAGKYAGIGGDEPDSDINVTLGQIRTIQINIMGEVAVPGTYRLSPFSTVFHALYKANGINDLGSMRDIQVVRNNKVIKHIDVYDYLFEGKQDGNIRLQEGDVIIVPPYSGLVGIDGNVKRPMYYEMTPEETIEDLITYAGGFTGDAYTEQIRLSRQTGRENELHNIANADFSTYRLTNGDLVSVGTILDRYANRVELKGSVFRPGMYALSSDLNTVKDLVNAAEGLMEDAYTTRVILYREGPNLQLEVIPLDLGAIMAGRAEDIALRRNDMLVIPSIQEMEDRGTLTITGMVARPGTFPYADNTTIEDIIVMAGGLIRGASTARIDVSRRINDPSALKSGIETAELFSFDLQDGLVVNGKKGFLLEPYDIVEVRRSPQYQTQRRVQVNGEVQFGGGYTLQVKNERLSDLVRRAGGVTKHAYLRGAHLTRKMSEDEIAARNEALRLAATTQGGNGSDSISMAKLMTATRYTVGIELDKALANPVSSADLVLQEGDELFIPEMNNTVKISGDVMFPNTVVFQEGKKLKYYIEQAGGYGSQAKKSKAFIVYMNGTVARAKGNAPIEPGCHIVIPSKHKNNLKLAEILSISTTAASLGMMGAAIANLFK